MHRRCSVAISSLAAMSLVAGCYGGNGDAILAQFGEEESGTGTGCESDHTGLVEVVNETDNGESGSNGFTVRVYIDGHNEGTITGGHVDSYVVEEGSHDISVVHAGAGIDIGCDWENEAIFECETASFVCDSFVLGG